MKIRKKWTIGLVSLFVSVLFVTDAVGQQQGHHPDGPPKPPVVTALDTDGDGTLSKAEIDNASKALIKLDRNNDGKLTREELRPRSKGHRGPGGQDGSRGRGMQANMPPQQQGGQRPKPPVISALDADNDGIISTRELNNAVEALKKLDKNNDGILTHEELRPQFGSRGDRGGQRGQSRRNNQG